MPSDYRGDSADTSMRQLLRDLPVLKGRPPACDLESTPADPIAFFGSWLKAAIAAGFPEPHAMTLSTVEAGAPDARVLILKDVDDRGLYFAGSANSRKGQQLSAMPAAALTFYWPQLARQIRVRGDVVPAGPEATRSDFLGRSTSARAIAGMGRQSQVIAEGDDVGARLREAESRVSQQSDTVPEHWRLYVLAPKSFEFFQASEDRLHLRLRYERARGGWEKARLWP
jgi:pyridoxamine 5'-phosphate oxidase